MKLRLGRNAANNFLGGVLPAFAALVTLPLIVRHLGVEAYGLFTLVTAIVGYFAVIDVNVTAGSVKHLSHFHALDRPAEASEVIVFGGAVYLGIGLVGALLLFLLGDSLIQRVFQVPASMTGMAHDCLRIAALGFLFGQLQSYLLSIPQALLRYDISSQTEMVFGVLTPLATVCVLLLGFGLVEVIAIRVALSALNCLGLLLIVGRLAPWFEWRRPSRAVIREVSGFSAYAFLSRLASLSYAHLDKLVIGGALGLAALSYYTVAATVGNRVMAMMFRISAVVFPATSALAARGDVETLRALYLRLSRYIGFVNATILLTIATIAEPLLRHWIGAEFAAQGALVLQVMACAQFVDSLTNLPSLVNDGMGHARVSGLFAVTRAIVGLAAIWLMVRVGGIEGVAFAHLGAATLMACAFLAYVHGRTVPCALAELWRRAYWPGLAFALSLAAVAAVVSTLMDATWLRQGLLATALVLVMAAFGYAYVLLPHDRATLRSWWTRWRAGQGAA